MKKLMILALFVALVMGFASGAWAYSYTCTGVLTDTVGGGILKVDAWDPADTAGSNPYFGTGFWGYIYTITNVDYTPYLTDFAIAKPAVADVALVATPAGWVYNSYPGSFGWAAISGSQLYAGNSVTGFEVQSTHGPHNAEATAWTPGNDPAYGHIAGPGVPEPASMAMFGLGLLGFGGRVIRKKWFKA